MYSFWIIFKQAFKTKAMTKSFMITTLVVVASFFLLANLPSIIESFDGDDNSQQTLQVVDETGQYTEALQAQLDQQDSAIQLEASALSEEQLRADVEAGEMDAFLVLEGDDGITARYIAESATESAQAAEVENALQSLQTARVAEQLELEETELAQLFAPVEMEREALAESSKSQEELSQARGLVYILIMVIYIAVIYYPNMIAMEVANEKSSRVMEILISSVSPVKHMFAKIAGIGSLGILQMMIFAVAGYLAIQSSGSDLTEGVFSVMGFSEVKFSTFFYAILFFLLGYFLYAVLAALLGSLVSRTEDVQQLMLPMMILIIIASFIAFSGISMPEAGYVTVASYIPFFAPLVMFLRVGLLDIPLWEPLLSIAIMLLTIGILGWFGARVYRGGVLMYGSSQSLKDIRRAIKLGNEK
ncbi:ABC transporter permease [Planococcus sp. CP5-4]|uniref:ABC transporter permease n=1 Tax=unclassified Planococcus (in: firmicutes) TaxID=2662419 RepID=UPI001C22F335|nr:MULTISPECIES: ABC transporter permease [unclassified Planococcus (in: firmicutes)]MBU9674137.1 ABC transporter permease [Planococcus sp. CP5-4_YE]MBV0910044.1 ABC transporter permease [Planococcus sp. CP5-4_UN]MBW6064578.1 ABC transporter permease [Planococcus sp. CP5-4]